VIRVRLVGDANDLGVIISVNGRVIDWLTLAYGVDKRGYQSIDENFR